LDPYSVELWRWWIDSAARRTYSSEAFNLAHAKPSDRIGLEGDVIG